MCVASGRYVLRQVTDGIGYIVSEEHTADVKAFQTALPRQIGQEYFIFFTVRHHLPLHLLQSQFKAHCDDNVATQLLPCCSELMKLKEVNQEEVQISFNESAF